MMSLTTRPPSRFSNCFSQQLRIIFKPPNINPLLRIGCKLIQIIPTQQPNRVLIHKPPRIRLIVAEEVVVQPRLTVGVLVLQLEGLVSSSGYVGFTLQFAPTVIIPESNQIVLLIGYLSWDVDLVAVEVVGLSAVFAVFVDVASTGETAYIYTTHSMSGLKVLCRLRLTLIIKLESFC